NNNNNNSNYNKSLDVSTSRLISNSTDNYQGILVFELDAKDSPIIQESHPESEPTIIPECASRIGCLYDDNKSPSDSELGNSTLNPIESLKIPPQTKNHSKISRNNNYNNKLKLLRKQHVGRSRNESFEHDKLEVTILGLFELSTGNEPRHEGLTELAAAQLAIDRVNQMDMLDNFRLRLIHNDTKSDPGVAVDRFFYALYTEKKSTLMPFLLGTASSEVTETLAKIVPYWNVVQVSFGSTGPALSDQFEFPLFLRTVAPDSSHNPARIALIKHFGWDTVTALSQNGDMYSLAVNDLVTELEQANITCTATITFGENDYKEQLKLLKEFDTRIIIGSFSPKLAPLLFCE
ncbi:GSCOCG00008021001-RA-CDS, partial [Cotesia congregata]